MENMTHSVVVVFKFRHIHQGTFLWTPYWRCCLFASLLSAAQNRCDVNVLERLSWCRDAQENDFLIEGSSDLWKVLVGVNKKVVLGCQPYCARILYYRK